jgi:hypothetical protein
MLRTAAVSLLPRLGLSCGRYECIQRFASAVAAAEAGGGDAERKQVRTGHLKGLLSCKRVISVCIELLCLWLGSPVSTGCSL